MDYIGTYATHVQSWEWIGLNPNPIGFFHLDSMDLDLIGYGYPIALDSIGLDFVGQKVKDNPNSIGLWTDEMLLA